MLMLMLVPRLIEKEIIIWNLSWLANVFVSLNSLGSDNYFYVE